MNKELQILRETAVPWNAYKKEKAAATSLLWVGIIFLIIGVFFVMAEINDAKGLLKLIFALFPIAGFIMVIMSYFGRKRAADLNDKLYDMGSDKVNLLEGVVNDVENSDPQNHRDVFSFCHYEGSGKNRRTIYWHAKVNPDHIAVLRKPMNEIHFPDREDFRILKGNKAFLSGDFSARVNIGGMEYNIFISPESYEKYINCLESAFEESSSSSETKKDTSRDSDSDEIVKLDV